MPAETHQRGRLAGRDEIHTLPSVLLGGSSGEVTEDTILASLGVDDEPALWDPWDAVREEFGERTIGTVDPGEALDPTMTVGEAAASMARLLAPDGGEGDASGHQSGGDQ